MKTYHIVLTAEQVTLLQVAAASAIDTAMVTKAESEVLDLLSGMLDLSTLDADAINHFDL